MKLQILGDSLIIAFGIVLIYIFTQVEIFGSYGMEANKYLRWFEIFMGFPVIAVGLILFRRHSKKGFKHGN